MKFKNEKTTKKFMKPQICQNSKDGGHDGVTIFNYASSHQTPLKH